VALGLSPERERERGAAMGKLRVDMARLTKEVSGKSVSHVTQPDAQRLGIHFTDGSVLAIALLQAAGVYRETSRYPALHHDRR
jgi:hypothetical protein